MVYRRGESDSIDHTFLECQCTKSFTQDGLQWFNVENNFNFNFNLNTEDFRFGLSLVFLCILFLSINFTSPFVTMILQ